MCTCCASAALELSAGSERRTSDPPSSEQRFGTHGAYLSRSSGVRARTAVAAVVAHARTDCCCAPARTDGSKRAFGSTCDHFAGYCTFFLFMTHGRLVAPKISTAGWQTAPVHGRLELLARPAGGPYTESGLGAAGGKQAVVYGKGRCLRDT